MKGNIAELGQLTEEIINSWPQKYEETKNGYCCKKCRSRILQTTCHVSIHAKEFEPSHAGSDKVVKINYPYCPKCDGKLDYATACFHVPIFKRQVIVIDNVTLLLNPGDGGEA